MAARSTFSKARPSTAVSRRGVAGKRVQWTEIDPSSAGYPWEQAALHPNNFPTPGLFYDAADRSSWFDIGAGPDGLVRAALGSALAMADLDPDIATSRQSHARRLRQQMRGLVLNDWNLELYGCSNENYCGGAHPAKAGGQGRRAVVDHVMGPKGLGLNWMPRHDDNRERLSQGRPARRTTAMNGDHILGVQGRKRPLVWIPPVDLERLQREGVVSSEGIYWADGSSVVRPPPSVARLGIQNPVALPGMPGFKELGE